MQQHCSREFCLELMKNSDLEHFKTISFILDTLTPAMITDDWSH